MVALTFALTVEGAGSCCPESTDAREYVEVES